MSSRIRGSGIALLAALGFLPLAAARAQEKPGKPNVLFIVCDDLNNRLGCYGDRVVKSPHIDRLAQGGVRFDRAYCQNPFCSPSRASFLSGRRPRSPLKDAISLPQHFHDHGYFTAMVGKVAHGNGNTADKKPWDVDERQAPKLANPGADEQKHAVRVARRIVELLEQNKDRPFLIAAGFQETHAGFSAPPRFNAVYPPEKTALPQEPPEHLKDIPAIARALDQAPLEYDKLTDAEKRKRIAGYQARISFVDSQVGVLLEAVDRLQLGDRLVIVLFGDHGLHLSEHGYWGKRSLFEESARVPLIVAAPGKQAGASCPRLVELVDLFPTLAELCGLPAPAGVEGTSFVPLLKDPQRAWKKAAFTQTEREKEKVIGRAVRTERYVYMEWGSEKIAQLYDHQDDPREYVNLIGSPRHAEVLAEMRRLLKEGWKGALPSP